MASKQNKPTLAEMIRADVGAASVAAMNAAVSDSDTGREQIAYIPRTSLVADPNNFYSVEGVDALAENIELVGLLDPLRVRPVEGENGLYRIVSGHRRRAALDKLALDGNKNFEQVPVIIERGSMSPAMQELRLIYANSDTRRMSSADVSKQAERVEMLLYELKEEGVEFPGRMRDHVAEACKVSATKLATLKKIRENLIDAWKERWEMDTLYESAAYVLAKMPAGRQSVLFDWFGNRDKYSVHEIFLQEYGETLRKIDSLKCPGSLGGGACSNRDNLRSSAYARNSCYPPCRTCCEGCYDLGKCKHACPKFAEQKKQQKEESAAKDAERIDLLAKLWTRARDLRKTSGLDIADFYRAAHGTAYLSGMNDIEGYDSGSKKIKANAETPFGYLLNLDALNSLVAFADKLGVSLDYLLCRTDDPTPPGNVSESDTAAPQWRTGTPEKDGRYWTCDVDGAQVVLWWHDGIWRVVPESNRPHSYDIVKWYPLPET